MFHCPHCEKPGIRPLSKAIAGPGQPARCGLCGQLARIDLRTWLIAILPGTALMTAAFFVQSSVLEWGLNLAGLGLMILLPLFFAGLRKE